MLRPRHRGCVATIGAFDGVHRGHQAVLAQVLAEARSLALPTTVIVFEPLPREYLRPAEAPARLMSFREKFRALAGLGVDRLLRIRFDEALRTMSAAAFVERIFVAGLGTRRLVLGDDFRFGRAREGDYEFLCSQGQRYGFETRATATLTVAGARVSSTRIRDALAAGDLPLAKELLGRPYTISGRVARGQGSARPVEVALRRQRVPLAGVFAVRVSGGACQGARAVAWVARGEAPGEGSGARLEVHGLDAGPGLCGKRIDVQFLHRLRSARAPGNPDAPPAGRQGDVEAARAWFAAPSTESDDR